jgi:hypothetical protein
MSPEILSMITARIRHRSLHLTMAVLLAVTYAFAGCGTIEKSGDTDTVFVYSYFREPNGHDGLHLAYSEDFFTWTEIPGAHFLSDMGTTRELDGKEYHVFRDAFVAPDPAGGFHMVWTSGWGRKDIGYAHSDDLITWDSRQLIPVMEHRDAANNCWAPKLHYDETGNRWMILWSTWLSDDTFPQPIVPDTGKNHRIWYVTTTDFETFSAAHVLFDPGFSCIDAYIFQDGPRHRLFFKDERANDGKIYSPETPAYQNIRMATAENPTGRYGEISPPITGQGPSDTSMWHNEGPCAIRVGEFTYVFYDHHGGSPYFGAVRSSDLLHWEDVTGQFSFPEKSKHGHIFRVQIAEIQPVLEKHGFLPE